MGMVGLVSGFWGLDRILWWRENGNDNNDVVRWECTPTHRDETAMNGAPELWG